MTNRQRTTQEVEQILKEGTLIDEALRNAAREAIWEHRRHGLPLVYWIDGRVCWLEPYTFQEVTEDWKRTPEELFGPIPESISPPSASTASPTPD